MNANNPQVGSAKMDRLLLLVVVVSLVALANLRGYGTAGVLKVILRFADALVNAFVAFAA